MKKPLHLPVLFSALVLCFLVAAVGGLSTADAVRDWYPTLDKPPWTPPNWAFGPVWTFLYSTMAIGFWHAWRQDQDRRKLLGWFAAQLTLNALWSPVFFGAKLTGPGLFIIATLWITLIGCGVVFGRVSRLSGALYLPYWVWVSIASSLNAWIWWFN